MREGFGVSRSHVDVAGAIDLVKQPVGDSPEFHHFLADSELVNQCRGSISTVCAGIFAVPQLAGKKQPDFSPVQCLTQQRNCSKQGLKVAIVVVVAHKKEPQVVFAKFKLLSHVLWQRRLVTEEGLVVKSVVNRCNL